MKKLSSFNPSSLVLDSCCYLFIEWLCRNELYRKFVRNHSRALNCRDSANRLIRFHISCMLATPLLSMKDAIESAFPFDKSLEGCEFWKRVSADWISFCNVYFHK